ncbi:MAG: type I-U CRISPR-associated protein Cas5/Cas6 [Gammaproteobacteria bacterium]|nr:type I-U CRISPR-associated protein Cas5/Cas6 [Gammaproteobacteria bacterium]
MTRRQPGNLVLEIEFLTGTYRGSTGPAAVAADWPPQPDRAFSALVASWAARGERPEETAALEWLERQPAPKIHASGSEVRSAPDVFVPPNDATTSRAKTARDVFPPLRRRLPRRFPVARPYDPVMRVVWEGCSDHTHLDALNAVARDVTYLGHSASLVRCRFLVGGDAGCHAPQRARTRMHPGRLRELTAAHAHNPTRPVIPTATSNPPPPPQPLFQGTGPLILEAIGEAPDIRASAIVCRKLRHALMSGYRRTVGEDRIPESISGHAPGGSPTRAPHLAIQPMAFVGHRHADARVFGYALIPPRSGSSPLDGAKFRAAFEAVTDYDEGHERRLLRLRGRPLPAPIDLSPAGSNTVRSLQFDPYAAPSRVWASVTPVVLDRHLKRDPDREAREMVARSCERQGLPRPSHERIRIGNDAAFAEIPPARAPAKPPWSRWHVPPPFATRAVVHVLIEFDAPVCGPVLLGAARFSGLGLLRGIDRRTECA